MSEKGKKNKKKTGLGLAIWILLFLIILIVFLVKQEEIKENFDKSGATALIEKKIGKDIFEDKKSDAKDNGNKDTVIELNLKKNEPVKKSEKKKAEEPKKTEKVSEKPVQNSKKEEKKTELSLKPAENTEVKAKTSEESAQKVSKTENQQKAQTAEKVQAEQNTQKTAPIDTNVKTEPVKVAAKPVLEPIVKTTPAKICFVAIDSEGPVVRKEVTRNVPKDSPLLEAIKSLLKGPSANEAKTGCMTYIPPESQLLGVSIKDGVAYLNFNEEFQFNPNGPDAANIQLMQIVYTATSFPTVKSVQFLIEGKNLQYLTEGVWIGSPLGRNRF